MALSTLFYITITVFIIAIILNVVAIWMASKGLTRDDNNNFIPDILEEKFADIKKDIKSLTKTVKPIENFTKDDYFISEMKRIEELKKKNK